MRRLRARPCQRSAPIFVFAVAEIASAIAIFAVAALETSNVPEPRRWMVPRRPRLALAVTREPSADVYHSPLAADGGGNGGSSGAAAPTILPPAVARRASGDRHAAAACAADALKSGPAGDMRRVMEPLPRRVIVGLRSGERSAAFLPPTRMGGALPPEALLAIGSGVLRRIVSEKRCASASSAARWLSMSELPPPPPRSELVERDNAMRLSMSVSPPARRAGSEWSRRRMPPLGASEMDRRRHAGDGGGSSAAEVVQMLGRRVP